MRFLYRGSTEFFFDIGASVVLKGGIAGVILTFHPVFPKVAQEHAARRLNIHMKYIGLIPKERLVIEGKLDSLKATGVDETGWGRPSMDILFVMDRFFRVLVPKIPGEIDMTKINQIIAFRMQGQNARPQFRNGMFTAGPRDHVAVETEDPMKPRLTQGKIGEVVEI